MLYAFGKAVTYLYVRLLFRVRYVGLTNIPADKGFILASNHRGYHDPLFIAHRVPKRVYYMAKAELFRNRVLGWLFRSVGAFPVDRGSGDASTLDTARGIIERGEVLGMFPEGTRSKDGKPLRARSGVSLIAAQTGADVLPCAICYGEKLRFRTPVTVRYGKVIPAAELGADAGKPSTLRAASKRIMGDIVAMLGEGAA